jgi:hypothetical protein
MVKHNQNIECPNCGHPIDVNDILYHQLQDKVDKEYNTKLLELEKQKGKVSESIEEGVRKQLQTEKSKMEKKIRTQISEETAGEIQSYQEQLEEKTKEVGRLNLLKSELSRVKREKDELAEKIQAAAEEKLNSMIKDEKIKIRSQVDRENELKISEKDRMIEDLNGRVKEMQRKIEQGSMQVTGEIQELAIEDFLKSNFPLDIIDEIKKGARGGDCYQLVNTHTRQNCGSIYYESKRTKDFQPSWIEKFKEDMRLRNATFGVLVTEVMPKGFERLGKLDGIWVCNYQEFKGLCYVLRESVILYSDIVSSQENKGEKMGMLYEYLTGNEFKMQVEAIVEGFSQMEVDLASERRSIESIWKKREKQIQKVLHNTIHMYSSIKGIAGSSLPSIKILELPAPVKE